VELIKGEVMSDEELLADYTNWLQTQEAPATPPPVPEIYVQSKDQQFTQNVMPQSNPILGPLSNISMDRTYAQAIPQGYVAGGEMKYSQPVGQEGVLSPFVAGNRIVSGNTTKNNITGGGLEYQGNGFTMGVRHDVNGVMNPSMNTVQQKYGNAPERGTKDPFMEGSMQPQKNLTQFYVSKAF
jgi:hypothetical protein